MASETQGQDMASKKQKVTIELHPSQVAAVQRALAALGQGKGVLFGMDTGEGKTASAGELARHMSNGTSKGVLTLAAKIEHHAAALIKLDDSKLLGETNLALEYLEALVDTDAAAKLIAKYNTACANPEVDPENDD